jgi:hypothetical protein
MRFSNLQSPIAPRSLASAECQTRAAGTSPAIAHCSMSEIISHPRRSTSSTEPADPPSTASATSCRYPSRLCTGLPNQTQNVSRDPKKPRQDKWRRTYSEFRVVFRPDRGKVHRGVFYRVQRGQRAVPEEKAEDGDVPLSPLIRNFRSTLP